MPSICSEAFGLVAAEAMMRGTAVVASDVGGLPEIAEIVQHGNTGLLLPVGDVDALADALFQLLQNRELAEKMGNAGREVATARFSEEAMANRFLKLYQSLLQ